MSNNNNLRDQFPGFAKIDTAVNIMINLGYITLVGVFILWGCKGIFTLLLPQSKVDEGVDLVYGSRLTAVVLAAIIAAFTYQVMTGNKDQQVTTTVYVVIAAMAITMGGFVMWLIARALGKDED
jgi:hypothetical protein